MDPEGQQNDEIQEKRRIRNKSLEPLVPLYELFEEKKEN